MGNFFYLSIYALLIIVGCVVVYWIIKETTQKKTYYKYGEIKQKYNSIVSLRNIDDFDLMHQYIESNPNLTTKQTKELRELLGSKMISDNPSKKLDIHDTINN